MGTYTILRIYEVPADNQQEATDRMMEAVALHVEKDFHVRDILREPGAKPGQGKAVDLKPPAGWLTLLKQRNRSPPSAGGDKSDVLWTKIVIN
jgi:hypothetical protein